MCASPAADDELADICAPEVDDVRAPLSNADACACASGERDVVVVALAGTPTVAVVARIIEIVSKCDFINRSLTSSDSENVVAQWSAARRLIGR